MSESAARHSEHLEARILALENRLSAVEAAVQTQSSDDSHTNGNPVTVSDSKRSVTLSDPIIDHSVAQSCSSDRSQCAQAAPASSTSTNKLVADPCTAEGENAS
eukprot:COSAG03_NODE_7171_length_954_cov_1.685380_1_plen_103_part_10